MVEFEINTILVQDLLSTHAVEWAELPIREINSTGTDNALFMLGNDCVLRIPKRAPAKPLLEKELSWLPIFHGLPLAVPELLHRGKSRRNFEFGIFKWIQGQIATHDRISNAKQATIALADFLTALQKVDTAYAPHAGQQNNNRGIDLVELSATVDASLILLADEINLTQARSLWEKACSASVSDKPVWVHGDLKSDNMIAVEGALAGVIDWGLSAVGDPAVDFAAAWTWIEPEYRKLFRNICQIDEDAWHRAKGWALYCAIIALSYYRGKSHEALCKQSRGTLGRLELLL